MLLDITPLRKHRDYRLLYIGQTVSFFGSMMTYVAVPYQLYELTKSSFLVGMLGSAQLVPLLIFALWGGAYADSLDRRKLLVISEMILAVGTGILTVNSLVPHPSVAVIFVVAALMSGVNGFHRPALDSLTPRLVHADDLPSVGALGSLRSSLGMVAGPAIAGMCIAHLGLAATYITDVVSFVISVIALAQLRPLPIAPEARPPGISTIVEGLRYAKSRPELVGTYVVDIIAMTFAMPMALFPALAEQWGGAKAVGSLYSAMPFGALAITLFSGWAKKVKRQGVMVVLAAGSWGVAIFALAFTGSFHWALFWLAAAGAADMVSGLFRGAIWNETIPSQLRGRLAGVEMISYMSGPLIGNARAGWMASWGGNMLSIGVGGALCIGGVLACVPLLPKFWHYTRPVNS